MHQLDRKILRLSVTVLFLSILVVYALFYQVKGTQIKNRGSDNDSNITQIYVKSGDDKMIIGSLDKGIVEDKKIEKDLESYTLTNINTGNKNLTGENLNESGNLIKSNEIKYLSGTNLFYGILESIEKLGISYKYILQDKKGIYYIYLGDFKYDIVSITRKLGGSIYTINTEQEILKNKLFGDKVMFINLPEYKNKIVLMMLYIDKEIRLLQLDYNTYHKSKNYLQSLFID